MKLNYLFSNLNLIVLVVWFLFLIVVSIRFFCPNLIRNISYSKLLFVAFIFNIFYGLFVTWAQYYVWKISDSTGTFTNIHYFSGYVWTHFWLHIILSFLLAGILYYFFRIWKFYRGGFADEGPILLLILMLIPGWRGILILMPLGFIIAIFFFLFSFLFKDKKNVVIEPAFIISTFFALLFSNIIWSFL